ncbi:MAG TPA: ATP-binding protein [Ktedonobacteraceae bacterium]
MGKEQFIREALSLPSNAIEYYVSQILADMYKQKSLVEGGDGLFDIEEYASAGFCTVTLKTLVYNHVVTHYNGQEISIPGMPHGFLKMSGLLPFNLGQHAVDSDKELIERAKNAWLEVQWRGSTFDIVVMNWFEGRPVYHYWILADQIETAREFLREVCRWNAEVRGEVLVFDGGCWSKDAMLFQSIKGATFDNLILKGQLKEGIRTDLQQFFAARALYEEYGVPWKRGILFVGPPGNGKTHAVKAIINALTQPCLYVKSFRTQHNTDDDNIRQVFDRARKTAPCILVLEDLDALLNNENRSFFLNELDGFAANAGIVTLATTNHPERLDPAILDRPSRFDRKYPFNLPEAVERLAYLKLWNSSLKAALQLDEEGVASLGELTEGFSFAYLKELFLSSMMRWIAREQQESQPINMQETMTAQIDILRAQMISANKLEEEAPATSALPGMPGFMLRGGFPIRR